MAAFVLQRQSLVDCNSGVQSLAYLLSGSLDKKFDDLWYRGKNT